MARPNIRASRTFADRTIFPHTPNGCGDGRPHFGHIFASLLIGVSQSRHAVIAMMYLV
jgi:hypothetical protein